MLWILFVGLVAGILARLLSPGPNKPGGFILTIVLGVAGAFLATFIGQTIGWYRADQGAGFITATLGACWCCSSGTGWWRRAGSAIPASGRGSKAHPSSPAALPPFAPARMIGGTTLHAWGERSCRFASTVSRR